MTRTVLDLKKGETSEISGFVSEDNILKLLEMGFLPGSKVKLKHLAPFKGPLFVNVGGNDMAIRRGIAKNILILPKQ